MIINSVPTPNACGSVFAPWASASVAALRREPRDRRRRRFSERK